MYNKIKQEEIHQNRTKQMNRGKTSKNKKKGQQNTKLSAIIHMQRTTSERKRGVSGRERDRDTERDKILLKKEKKPKPLIRYYVIRNCQR